MSPCPQSLRKLLVSLPKQREIKAQLEYLSGSKPDELTDILGKGIDKVDHVSHVSSAGVIPEPWLRLAKWDQAVNPHQFGDDPGDPPDHFWMTLVADRGTHSNPPYYYARACRETVMRGGLRSGAVDTMALKSYERNSIIAEFCRRVQSVIWNRAMIKTASGKLGLVSNSVKEGDLICILHGCTVPVILRRGSRKTVTTRVAEQVQDSLEAMKSAMKTCVKRRALRAQYRKKKELDEAYEEFIKAKLEVERTKHKRQRAKTFRFNRPESTPSEVNPKSTGGTQETHQATSTSTGAGNANSRPRRSHFNHIKNMDGLGLAELLTCWPASPKTQSNVPDEDNLSEDDFIDKRKEAENSARWGRIWEKRAKEVAEKEGQQREEEYEEDEEMEEQDKEQRRTTMATGNGYEKGPMASLHLSGRGLRSWDHGRGGCL